MLGKQKSFVGGCQSNLSEPTTAPALNITSQHCALCKIHCTPYYRLKFFDKGWNKNYIFFSNMFCKKGKCTPDTSFTTTLYSVPSWPVDCLAARLVEPQPHWWLRGGAAGSAEAGRKPGQIPRSPLHFPTAPKLGRLDDTGHRLLQDCSSRTAPPGLLLHPSEGSRSSSGRRSGLLVGRTQAEVSCCCRPHHSGCPPLNGHSASTPTCLLTRLDRV